MGQAIPFHCLIALPLYAGLHSQAKQREQYLAEQQRLDEYNSQVDTIKNTLTKAATELAQATAQTAQAKQDLDEKRKRLDAARKR